mmetsp:Transcript_18290/g.49163  ORF Transcript_18290/g.49163 Transcript_18290/m.49163 type:complete len:209 (-) Transcript_18290:302-928(-)
MCSPSETGLVTTTAAGNKLVIFNAAVLEGALSLKLATSIGVFPVYGTKCSVVVLRWKGKLLMTKRNLTRRNILQETLGPTPARRPPVKTSLQSCASSLISAGRNLVLHLLMARDMGRDFPRHVAKKFLVLLFLSTTTVSRDGVQVLFLDLLMHILTAISCGGLLMVYGVWLQWRLAVFHDVQHFLKRFPRYLGFSRPARRVRCVFTCC